MEINETYKEPGLDKREMINNFDQFKVMEENHDIKSHLSYNDDYYTTEIDKKKFN